MRSPRCPLSFRAAAVAAAALSILGAATASAAPSASPPDSSTPADDGFELLDEGDTAGRVDLTPPRVPGTVYRTDDVSGATGRVTVSGPQDLDETFDVTTTSRRISEVLDVSSDGSSTVRRTVESYDESVDEGDPVIAGSFSCCPELEAIVGLALDYQYDAQGDLVDVVPAGDVEVTDDQRESIAELIEIGDGPAVLPEGDVGVGAAWSVTVPVPPFAEATGTYELASIDDGTATVDYEYVADLQSASLPEGFDEITGDVRGGGTFTVVLENGVAGTDESWTDSDVTMTGDAGEMTMDMSLSFRTVVTVD